MCTHVPFILGVRSAVSSCLHCYPTVCVLHPLLLIHCSPPAAAHHCCLLSVECPLLPARCWPLHACLPQHLPQAAPHAVWHSATSLRAGWVLTLWLESWGHPKLVQW